MLSASFEDYPRLGHAENDILESHTGTDRGVKAIRVTPCRCIIYEVGQVTKKNCAPEEPLIEGRVDNKSGSMHSSFMNPTFIFFTVQLGADMVLMKSSWSF